MSANYVHTLDFVHKNIRPENILGFGSSGLGSFSLVGFQQIRSADGITCLNSDNAWERNLYRHPQRQGEHPEESYRMQHDIYSLGVCLLEIGLWQTFVTYGDDNKPEYPGSVLGLSLEELQRKRPNAVKKHLETLTQQGLPSVTGELYSEVVMSCLSCLDEDNEDFGDIDGSEDADGILVGVRYIEKVCSTDYSLLQVNAKDFADPTQAECYIRMSRSAPL
jgi:serine/threonine protein kinase